MQKSFNSHRTPILCLRRPFKMEYARVTERFIVCIMAVTEAKTIYEKR